MPGIGWKDLPSLYRHCVCAVYHKSTGGSTGGIISALKICRAKLAEQGYLYQTGGTKIIDGIRLTGKGWVRNQKHLMEGFAGSSKDNQFAALFKQIEPQLYELDGVKNKEIKAVPGKIDDQARNNIKLQTAKQVSGKVEGVPPPKQSSAPPRKKLNAEPPPSKRRK